jgi:branched-chain amino acid transport system substrate-binding protein
MFHQHEIRTLTRLGAWLLVAAGFALSHVAASAQSGNPIKIGYGISQTGGLAPNGKSALLAQQIWEEDVNAKGGLLGRHVKLLRRSDQSGDGPRPVPEATRRRQGRHRHRRVRY